MRDMESAAGLREALILLNSYRENSDWDEEPPYFVATNALLTEVANREGKSIQQVSDELRDAM